MVHAGAAEKEVATQRGSACGEAAFTFNDAIGAALECLSRFADYATSLRLFFFSAASA